MSDLLTQLLADLDTETTELRAVVEAAGDEGWTTPTPAEGWTVATQVAHLAWTDTAAVAAARARTGDPAWDDLVARATDDPAGYVDTEALALAEHPRAEVLDRWAGGAADLVAELTAYPAGERLVWFGPPMSPTSMATARFMETWAHGIDVRQALGAPIEPTDRIRHVAHLGVRTRGFAFAAHGIDQPFTDVRVELTAPSGEVWTWGPDDAPDTVTGPAWDFCLLVTQRIHRDDTTLEATAGAETWLSIAQAFAGPPGPGRGRTA